MDINRETWEEAWAEAEQFGMEEAQAAPQQTVEDAPAPTPEVHDEPGIPQQEEQQQGIAVGEPDPTSGGDIAEDGLGGWDDDFSPDFILRPEDPTSGGDIAEEGLGGWDDDFSPDFFDRPEEPTPGGYDDMLGISKEDIEGPSSDTDGDGASDLDEAREDATPGGYDGSGIAGGLDLDQNGVFDQIENNPDILQPGYPGNDPAGQHEGNVFPDEAGTDPDASDGGGYTYDEGAYEDAEDAFEDLQDALQDGDEEDLSAALEELQGYLGGFDKVGAKDEAPASPAATLRSFRTPWIRRRRTRPTLPERPSADRPSVLQERPPAPEPSAKLVTSAIWTSAMSSTISS